jgi:hypothetical protein
LVRLKDILLRFLLLCPTRQISSCKIYNKTTGTIGGTTYEGGEFSFGNGF